MSLKDQVVFVAGGCGIVGSGFVVSLLQEGAICWVTSRDDARFNELKEIVPVENHSKLFNYHGDVIDEQVCIALREEILRQHGQINHVIVSIGGWWEEATLSEVSVETYERVVRSMTLGHFVVYKTFAKLLSARPNSTFTFISGGSAEAAEFMPKASLIPISSATVAGMYTSAVSEFKNHENLAVIQFRLFLWIRKTPDSNFDPKTSDFEVGHDYIGKFMPKLILRHKSELYRIRNREQGDELFQQLNN